jgi:dephospho-CoA kinase
MTRRIKKIGVTGGIGTGKTTVCKMLEAQGCAIFSADDAAKRLQETDCEIVVGLKKIFGDAIYENGIPNRKKIAREIFADSQKLQELNALIHPKVFQAFDRAAQQAEADGKKIIVKEAAILFESGGDKGIDAIVVVAADLETRLKRLTQRGLSEDEAKARIAKQLPQDVLLKRADVVIWNNKSFLELEREVSRAYQELLSAMAIT